MSRLITWEPGDGTRYEVLAARTTGIMFAGSDWCFVDTHSRRAFFCREDAGYLVGSYVQEKTGEKNLYHCDVLTIVACFVTGRPAGPVTERGNKLLASVAAGEAPAFGIQFSEVDK